MFTYDRLYVNIFNNWYIETISDAILCGCNANDDIFPVEVGLEFKMSYPTD